MQTHVYIYNLKEKDANHRDITIVLLGDRLCNTGRNLCSKMSDCTIYLKPKNQQPCHGSKLLLATKIKVGVNKREKKIGVHVHHV